MRLMIGETALSREPGRAAAEPGRHDGPVEERPVGRTSWIQRAASDRRTHLGRAPPALARERTGPHGSGLRASTMPTPRPRVLPAPGNGATAAPAVRAAPAAAAAPARK